MSSPLSRKDFIKSFTEAVTTKSSGLHLQPRDYDILRFILDQKFASLESIYFRFFDVRKSETDPLPKQFWTARQRLSKLRSIALIKTEKVLSSGRAHFLLTPFGFKVLSHKVKDVIPMKQTNQIDFSLYEHDSRLTIIRALLEAKDKSRLWYSEKRLKAAAILVDGKYKYHFSQDIRPDAVFINSKGEKVALELEMARKGRARLEEKFYFYDTLLKEQPRYGEDGYSGPSFRVVDKVWFVTTKPAVARHLNRAIESVAREKLCYRVDMFESVVPEYARP